MDNSNSSIQDNTFIVGNHTVTTRYYKRVQRTKPTNKVSVVNDETVTTDMDITMDNNIDINMDINMDNNMDITTDKNMDNMDITTDNNTDINTDNNMDIPMDNNSFHSKCDKKDLSEREEEDHLDRPHKLKRTKPLSRKEAIEEEMDNIISLLAKSFANLC